MKKIITTLALISLLAVPVISLAAPGQSTALTPVPAAAFEDVGGLMTILNRVGLWVFNGLLILAGIFLVVAGYFFIIAGGNPEKVNIARQMLINALIGVAVGVAAQGLIKIVENLIQG